MNSFCLQGGCRGSGRKKIKLLSKVIQADSVNEASLKIHKAEIYMSCILKLQKKRERSNIIKALSESYKRQEIQC